MYTIGLRFVIMRLGNIDEIILDFYYLLEINFRLIWVLLHVQSFLECFILNTLSILTIWLIVPFIYPADVYNRGMFNFFAYSCALMSVISFAYFLEKNSKKAFYFHWISDKKANWLSNVFENMNSGFVSFRGGRISYINSSLKKQLKKFKNFTKKYSPTNSEIFIKNQTNAILNNIEKYESKNKFFIH
jgi:hypothetical protein